MRKRRNFSILVLMCFTSLFASSPFDLTVESIRDSAALLAKIKQPGDPLHPYFSKGKAPATRADVIAVINDKVLPNADFAFETTGLEELKTTDRFESLDPDRQEEVLAKNRDLLTELYPDEIVPRDKALVRQGFGLKLPVKQVDGVAWLKAEMVSFLNEIIADEKIISDWKNLRQFFDEKVADSEIAAFVEAMKQYDKKRIPLNSVSVINRKNEKSADVMLKGRNDRADRKLFTVSFIAGKKWKILRIKDVEKDLLQAGFIEKKEVRQ